MAVVDLLISKTFDASVICPAEQTLRRRRRDLRRVRRRARADGRARARPRGGRSARRGRRSTPTAAPRIEALGRSCVDLAALAGIDAGERDKVLIAPLPADLDALAAHPLLREKLMPRARARALAVGRARASPSASWSPSTAASATPPPSTPATRPSSTRFAARIRTGRILVNAPTAVGALGGIYNRDAADLLARLRHLGRLDDDRQRQLPQPAQHQGGLAPPDAAAVVPRARRTPTSTPARSTACAR